MAEYIEKEKALDFISEVEPIICMPPDNKPTFTAVKDADMVAYLESLPAADVRPVVTCGECKHWFENGTDYCSCDRDALLRERDFFCAAGEKREER